MTLEIMLKQTILRIFYCFTDHVRALFDLNANVILQIKGLSSLYLNLKCGTSVSVNMLMATLASPYWYLLLSTPTLLLQLWQTKIGWLTGNTTTIVAAWRSCHILQISKLVNIQRD